MLNEEDIRELKNRARTGANGVQDLPIIGPIMLMMLIILWWYEEEELTSIISTSRWTKKYCSSRAEVAFPPISDWGITRKRLSVAIWNNNSVRTLKTYKKKYWPCAVYDREFRVLDYRNAHWLCAVFLCTHSWTQLTTRVHHKNKLIFIRLPWLR